MNTNLIYDIGCHVGDDTEFYLAKSFNVVAFDANRELCEQVAQRFDPQIKAGRLTVIYGALAPTDQEYIDFFINASLSDWGTIDPYMVERNAKAGTMATVTRVPVIKLTTVFERHGIPYYMKIDIEGADTVPLIQLQKVEDRPALISVEISLHDRAQGLDQIERLRQLGYTEFNFFNQGMRRSVKMPRPATEGTYAPLRAEQSTTGPFGSELPGSWMSYSHAVRRYEGIYRRHTLYRDNPLFSKNGGFGGTLLSKLHNRYRRHVLGDPVTWYDLHARRPLNE